MTASTPRKGNVALAVLLLMPLLFLVVALAIYAAELARVNGAIQANADADALAGAGALVDDSRLLDDPSLMPVLLARARQAAQLAADENVLGGRGVELRVPDDDVPAGEGDIEFGHKSSRDAEFEPIRVSSGAEALGRINAVQVRARRTSQHGDPLFLLRGPFLSRLPTDASARAVVLIEQDVIGVRPMPGINVPMAPIALLSDPKGKDEQSWERNTVKKKGPDDWSINHGGERPAPTNETGDGLHEMVVVLGDRKENAVLLDLSSPRTSASEQVAAGVSAGDLERLGGELVLDKDGKLKVPGLPKSAVPRDLGDALLAIRDRGEPRIFPLYVRNGGKGRGRGAEGGPGSQRTVTVTGFVVARVLAVRQGDGRLRFMVQPAMRSTPTAVTASSRGRKAEKNPYLARLRLAD